MANLSTGAPPPDGPGPGEGFVAATAPGTGYRGRFAPSPTGPLHAGSLVAALASRLDALAWQGRWLVGIEDVDRQRCLPGAAAGMLATLERFGFAWDETVLVQSTRDAWYQQALDRLSAAGLVYPCGCSRREIADSGAALSPDGATVYPGTCRDGLAPGRRARAWRVRSGAARIRFFDRRLGWREHDLASQTGDFVLKRADGAWAYQLAVVVDDALQGITDVVRGADLLDSTPRQIYLQRLLGWPTPRYLHVPVVVDRQGAKLSKQGGALALDPGAALAQLHEAARHLGLAEVSADSIASFWRQATVAWHAAWVARARDPDQITGSASAGEQVVPAGNLPLASLAALSPPSVSRSS